MGFGYDKGVSAGCFLARVDLRLGGQHPAACSHRAASRSAWAMTSTSRARSSLTTFTGPSAASPATADLGSRSLLADVVRPVALERVNEVLAGLVEVVGDDVKHVGVAAAGHPDVHPGCVQRVREEGVPAGGGDALDAVRGCGVREMHVLCSRTSRGGQRTGRCFDRLALSTAQTVPSLLMLWTAQVCRFATLSVLSFLRVAITSPTPIGSPSFPVVVVVSSTSPHVRR